MSLVNPVAAAAFFFFFSIEVKFTSDKIHHLKATFSTLTMLCSAHFLFQNIFIIP